MPAAVTAEGWWTGQICAYGHTAWSALTVKANRSFTIEATAQDEQNFCYDGEGDACDWGVELDAAGTQGLYRCR